MKAKIEKIVDYIWKVKNREEEFEVGCIRIDAELDFFERSGKELEFKDRAEVRLILTIIEKRNGAEIKKDLGGVSREKKWIRFEDFRVGRLWKVLDGDKEEVKNF